MAAEANTNGTTYHYVAFNEAAGGIKKGSYTGNNVDDRNLTGVGFEPGYLMIRANDTATARNGHHRPVSLFGGSSQFWGDIVNSTDGIQALQSDGFQVGTDTSVKASGPTYHYMAFRNSDGGCALSGRRRSRRGPIPGSMRPVRAPTRAPTAYSR